MKKSILCVAALIVAAIVSVTVVSCKKDKDEVVTNATNSEAQALLNRIEAFQTLRDAVNSGVKADGSMTVEEMRQALDLVSNYEHSEHMSNYSSTVLDTLHIAMPAVDEEGYVNEADVVATYNAFETALEKRMLEVNDGMNVPSYFSIVMPIEYTKDGNIDILFDRGIPSNDSLVAYSGPFGEDDDWYWGDQRGKCYDDCCYGTDAAGQLSLLFRFDNTPPSPNGVLILSNVEYVEYVSHDVNYTGGNPYCYFEDPNPQGCSDYWIFAHETDDGIWMPCIGHDEMNCYSRNINRLICSSSGPLHFSPNLHSPYNQCELIPRDLYPKGAPQDATVLVHIAKVRYCHALWLIPTEEER